MMQIPSELETVLVSSPDTLGGSVRFQGSRVPVRALLDAITCGRTVDYFVRAYPGVPKEQAEAVLKWEQDRAREVFGIALTG